MKVVNPNLIVKKHLATSRLDTVIDVRPDETSALQAFKKCA